MSLEHLPGHETPVGEDPLEWAEFLADVVKDETLTLQDRREAYQALKLLTERESRRIQPQQPRFRSATIAKPKLKPKKSVSKRVQPSHCQANFAHMGYRAQSTGQIHIQKNTRVER